MNTTLNVFRILIVDDNPAVHQDFKKILLADTSTTDLDLLSEDLFGKEEKIKDTETSQLLISTALQGKEAVDQIKQALDEKKPYALAFVDIRMPPGWDGIETIKHIWEVDPNIQIVICSAYSDYSWEETIKELGVTDNLLILKKPFDNVAVRQLASALTKKWQLMQETKAHIKSIEARIQERTSSLQNSLSMIKATLESTIEGILIIDSADQIVDFNRKFLELWEIPETILEQKLIEPLFEWMSNQTAFPKGLMSILDKVRAEPELTDLTTIRMLNEQVIELYTQSYGVNGKKVGRVWSFRDITQRVKLEEKLEYEATHDALTAIPNRVLLYDRIKQAIYTAARNQTLVGLLFFDLDRFKLINDSLGHNAGDELLRSIVSRLKPLVRNVDTFSRLGGDEFVIVLINIREAEKIIDIANKLLSALREPFEIADRNVVVTASVGISVYPNDGKTVDELLRYADLAMYQAKELGADKFCFYQPEMNIKSTQRLKNESELHNGLKNNEFFLNYQPQFDLTTKALIGVEALIRWQHPQKGLLLPLDFIPLAEETGLIIALGHWVLETACKQNKAWQMQGYKPIRMSVNVTTKQIQQPDFIAQLAKILKSTELSPEYLELELTENVLLNNPESYEMINQIRAMGIEIALDDFGTGTSSLNYLRKLSINRLKIDKSFIDCIGGRSTDEVILQAIISMARGLKLDVIAEGVESQKQLSFLQNSQCKEGQGYLLSKPVAPSDIEAILKSSESQNNLKDHK